MTVREVREDGCYCQWFAKSEALKSEVFPNYMLIEAKDVGAINIVLSEDDYKL